MGVCKKHRWHMLSPLKVFQIILVFQIEICVCCSPARVEELISDVELNAALVELGLLAGVAHRGHHHLPHHHRHRVRLLQLLFVIFFPTFLVSPASPRCLS